MITFQNKSIHSQNVLPNLNTLNEPKTSEEILKNLDKQIENISKKQEPDLMKPMNDDK